MTLLLDSAHILFHNTTVGSVLVFTPIKLLVFIRHSHPQSKLIDSMVREHKAVALLVFCLHLASIQSFILGALTQVLRPHGRLGRSARENTLVRAVAVVEDNPRMLFQHKLSSFMKTGDGKPSRKPLNVEDNYIDIDFLAKMLTEMKQEQGTTTSAPVPIVAEPSKTQAEYRIEQRIKNVKGAKSDAAGTATALSNILSEMRDKAVWNQELISSVMLSIARLEPPKESKGSAQPMVRRRLLDRSAPILRNVAVQNMLAGKQLAALKLYLRAVQDGCLAVDREFLRQFVLALYLHHSPCRAQCVELLAPLQFLDTTSLLPGEVCSAIHLYGATTNAETNEAMIKALGTYYARIGEFSIHDTHLVLRTLSRYQEVSHIYTLLQNVRGSGSQRGTVETMELLSQALVKSVGKGVRAESMAELPRPDRTVPEVVFVGRSNVGKSSLVNCLLNRKALASTSATPGHTRCFHFFPINQPATVDPVRAGSSSGPSVARTAKNSTVGSSNSEPIAPSKAPFKAYFVDVPGLGFAGNRSDSLMASWRGLLERYLHKRDPLSVVCHLVDARHGVTDVDREMITIAARAAEERASQGVPPFRYTIVITKTDKIAGEALRRMVQEVKEVMVDCMDTGDVAGGGDGESGVRNRPRKTKGDRKRLLDGVSVIPTSSVSREGAEKVWELIYECLLKRA